jgi:hypothetical protein
MVRRKRFALLPVFAALLVAGLLPALAHPASAQDASPTAAAPGGTFPVTARFVNAMTSVDTIDVDLNSDDNRVVQGLKYGEVSDPVQLTAPASNIIVKQPRKRRFDLWLFNTVVATQAGQSYVITVSDLLVIPVQVDTSPLKSGEARGRLVHAAAQAPPVDVLANDKPTKIKDLGYGQASDTGEVPAATYDFKLVQSGATTTTVVDVPGTALASGQSYVMVLIGKPGSTDQPLKVLSVATPAQPAS